MVARDNQWSPRTNSDTLSKFQDYQPPTMAIKPENMTQTSNFLLSHTKSMVARGNNGNQGHTVLHI